MLEFNFVGWYLITLILPLCLLFFTGYKWYILPHEEFKKQKKYKVITLVLSTLFLLQVVFTPFKVSNNIKTQEMVQSYDKEVQKDIDIEVKPRVEYNP